MHEAAVEGNNGGPERLPSSGEHRHHAPTPSPPVSPAPSLLRGRDVTPTEPRRSGEHIVAEPVDIKKINTLINVADLLTKLLAFKRYFELRDNDTQHRRIVSNRVD